MSQNRTDEMISLNLDELDVEELERRMELAVAGSHGSSFTCECDGVNNCTEDCGCFGFSCGCYNQCSSHNTCGIAYLTGTDSSI